MDLNFSKEDLDFQSEVREFLDKEYPKHIKEKMDNGDDLTRDEIVEWHKVVAKKGWMGHSWPVEHGGTGWDATKKYIYLRELAMEGCPMFIPFGLQMVAPVIWTFGSQKQKDYFLPRILNFDDWWCQGYSEPGSGSDLASLATKAEDMGDHFLVNGQKVWTSYADKADWIFALVRTGPKEPKHNGISFLLIDMENPGVSTKPITLISGKSPFCETFFDNVEVPKENLVGELNAGWTIAKKLLQHERKFISNFGLAAGMGSKKDVVSLAKKHFGEDEGKISNPIFRSKVIDHKMKEHAFGLTLQRAADEGGKASAVASMFKYYGTEHNKRRHELMVAASGVNGLAWDGNEFDDSEKNLTRAWLRTKGNSIEGGTSEVQLNVISKRVLELPSG